MGKKGMALFPHRNDRGQMRRRHCMSGALAESLRSLAPPHAAAASPGAAAILTCTASPRRSYSKVIVAPSANDPALQSMCRYTRVIISAFRPFLYHGLPLVEAYAECGTNYVGITGETLFVRRLMDLHSGTIELGGAAAATAAATSSTNSSDRTMERRNLQFQHSITRCRYIYSTVGATLTVLFSRAVGFCKPPHEQYLCPWHQFSCFSSSSIGGHQSLHTGPKYPTVPSRVPL